jgi:cell wall-associated NlpC family hydrolase
MRRTTKSFARILITTLVIAPLALSSLTSPSSAAPTKAQVDAAKSKLGELTERFERATEAYNDARVELADIRSKLADAKQERDAAQAEADEANAELADRAVEAYTGAGSKFDVLLGAKDFTEFSDRLEFMGAVARNDADVASAAEAAQQRAAWATDRFNEQLQAQEDTLAKMETLRADINAQLDDQQQLVDTLGRQYEAYLQAQREAAARAAAEARRAAAEAQQPPTTTTPPSNPGPTNPPPTNPPPTNPPDDPPSSPGGAGAAQAAATMVGKPYVFASASPSVGFDCSGLTSWAWAQVGVYLPHSARSQYAMLPKVSTMQPGDILFWYSDIHHVGIYVGGGMMVHASSSAGKVVYQSVAGYKSYGVPLMGIGRPG